MTFFFKSALDDYYSASSYLRNPCFKFYFLRILFFKIFISSPPNAVHRYKVVALHSYTHRTWLRFRGLGHLWSQNDVIMSWLRLMATSNCFPHPYQAYKKFFSTLICCQQAYGREMAILFSWQFVLLFVLPALATFCHFVWGRTFW